MVISTELRKVIVILALLLILLTPISNLIYVYSYDNNYKVCLKQVFKCQYTDQLVDLNALLNKN